MAGRVGRMRRGAALLVLLTMVTVGLGVGCSAGTENAVGSDEPQSGGTFTYSSVAQIPSSQGFDPALVTASQSGAVYGVVLPAVFDALFLQSADGEPMPRLATSIESTDATVWTITLRSGVEFSDGTPFDAAAVKFNWDRAADPAIESPSLPAFESIASTEAVDATTFQVTLESPLSSFPSLVAETNPMTFIGSPTALRDDPDDFRSNPVGAGAFTVEEYTDTQTRFVKNPRYYGDVYLDSVVYNVIPDPTQRLNTYRSGGQQATFLTSWTDYNTLESDPNSNVSNTSPQGGNVVMFNVAAPPFDDLRARQAMAYVMDAQEMSDTLYGGAAPVASTLYTEDSPHYDESATFPTADDERAQALFDELAAENRGPLDFTMVVPDAYAPQADWIQTKLADFSNVEMRQVPTTTGTTVPQYLAPGNFQAVMYSIAFSSTDPALYTKVMTDGLYNLGRYSNATVDGAMNDARRATTVEAQSAAYETMQQHLVEDLPFIPYHRQPNIVVYNTNEVQTWETWGLNIPLWNEISLREG